MRVKQVEYRHLVSDGNFNNVTYGCVIELAEGESETEAIEQARSTVEAWHSHSNDLVELKSACRTLQAEKYQMEYDLANQMNKTIKLKDFERKIRNRLGLEAIEDDIPF